MEDSDPQPEEKHMQELHQQSPSPSSSEPSLNEIQQQAQATAVLPKPQEMRPEECYICLHVYDEQECRPRMLPCGHTFCSKCLASLMKVDCLSCPTCRTNHSIRDITHFPINYDLEKMVKRVETQPDEVVSKATEETVEAISRKLKRTVVAGLSRKLRSLIQEQKMSMDSVQETVHQELDQLGKYRAQLSTSLAEHGRLLKDLDKLAQQHRDAMKLLEEEDLKVEAFMEEGEENHKEMKAAKDQLDVVNSAQEAFAIIDSADNSTAVAEEWLQHSKEEIPSGIAYSTSCRVVENTEAALQVIADEVDMPESITSGHLNCSLMEVVHKIHEKSVEIMDLHTTSKFKKMVEAGQVFGTEKKENGQNLFSQVTANGDKLFLHAMKKQLPPSGSFTFRQAAAAAGGSNKQICSYYLKGTCKDGVKCWNYHPPSQGGGSNVFGGMSNVFGGKSTSQQDSKEFTDFVKQVSREMTQWERSGQWLVSSFCPLKAHPPLVGFSDTSPEEFRIEAYQAIKNNTYAAYQAQWTDVQQRFKQLREALKMSTAESVQALFGAGTDSSPPTFGSPTALPETSASSSHFEAQLKKIVLKGHSKK